ncbi:hypothetical protein [Vibrio owensii]|uniref:hypothetical protein n=1 Tax=Vibrio harveyi group TaxID=717610 RepID=UPI003CC6268A
MTTSLNYKLISRESERGEWLGRAVPYGGHMLKYNLLPPLYELTPDYLVVSDNIVSGLESVIDVLECNQTAYFHLSLNEPERALKGLTSDVAKHLVEKIESLKCKGKNVVYLPAHAEMFYIFDDESDLLLLTHIFDRGELSSPVSQNPEYRLIHKTLSAVLKREFMIWKHSELNGPLISIVWSKRVINPSAIISTIAPTRENAMITRQIRKCKQEFKRKI